MLKLKPITLKEANIFVAKHHRHHPEAQGHKFSIGVSDAESLRGVAIAGRPVARMADDGWTAEVYRVCTDGAHNACSMLYGACWRAAKAMGYLRAITYTLPEEGGASLRAAGWVYLGRVKGGTWSRPSRKRDDDHPLGDKDKWGIGDVASMMRSAKPDEQFDDAGSGGELRLCESQVRRTTWAALGFSGPVLALAALEHLSQHTPNGALLAATALALLVWGAWRR